MEREKGGMKDKIIDRLEDARTLHLTARAAMIVSFLALTGAANIMKPEEFSSFATEGFVVMFTAAVIDVLTTPGAIRNVKER